MCGRYQLQVSSTVLQSSRPNTTWHEGHDVLHQPRQQVYPTNTAPVVVAEASPSAVPSPSTCEQSTAHNELVTMKWGFKMHGLPSGSSRPPLINARRETLLDLPTFRRVLKSRDRCRRCAIPITGFYEWHKSPPPGKKTLTPYLVHRTGQKSESDDPSSLAFLAGIFDYAVEDSVDYTFVIVTTASSKGFSWLHSRQPVFLSTEQLFNIWLDPTVSAEDAVASLNTETGLICVRMLKDLSAPATGTEKKQKDISSFFGKRSSTKSDMRETKLTCEDKQFKCEGPVLCNTPGYDTKEPCFSQAQSPEKTPNPSVVSLKPVPSIRKMSKDPLTSPQHKNTQKQMSSFFAKRKPD